MQTEVAVAAIEFVGHPDVGCFALAIGDEGVVMADVGVGFGQFAEGVVVAFEGIFEVVVAQLDGGEAVGCAGDGDDSAVECGCGGFEEEGFEVVEEGEVREVVGGEG